MAILGHSWGGFLAMRYALAYPGRVEKLILSNTMPASSDGLALFLQEWMERMGPYLEELACVQSSEAFQKGDPDAVEYVHRLMLRTYCYSPEKAELINIRMAAKAAQNGGEVFVPTLVIHGDTDPIPPAEAAKIHQSIPGSSFYLIDRCGHFPFVEEPKTYFKAINTFLDS